MPDHVRHQIRDAVVAALTGLATTGARVYRSRVFGVDRSTELPCLLVYALTEVSEVDTVDDGLMRLVDLAVVGLAEATADLDETLDTIAAEVEAVLGRSLLGGLVKDGWLAETEIRLDGEAAKPVAAVAMTWKYRYRTAEGDATVAQ